MKHTIYYDLDNTLAIFSIKGKESDSLEQMFNKGFFRNLPIMENVMETLSALMFDGHDVHLLSACINSPYCKSDKLEWIENYLPFIPKENIHLISVGTNKAEHIGNIKNSILIDDFHKNLKEWEQAGGIAIKKRYSNKKGYKHIIKNHLEIFDILERIGE